VTPNQYRSSLEALGLSQLSAAEFLGIGQRTSRSYALGESPVPEAVAKLLRLMVMLQIKPIDVK
jgi:hypothetical protein